MTQARLDEFKESPGAMLPFAKRGSAKMDNIWIDAKKLAEKIYFVTTICGMNKNTFVIWEAFKLSQFLAQRIASPS